MSKKSNSLPTVSRWNRNYRRSQKQLLSSSSQDDVDRSSLTPGFSSSQLPQNSDDDMESVYSFAPKPKSPPWWLWPLPPPEIPPPPPVTRRARFYWRYNEVWDYYRRGETLKILEHKMFDDYVLGECIFQADIHGVIRGHHLRWRDYR